jgi:hypothetical protein
VNIERDIIHGANPAGKNLGQVSDFEQRHEAMLAAIAAGRHEFLWQQPIVEAYFSLRG